MKYITINDLDPSLFVSNQVKNTYSRELDIENNLGGGDLGSSASISRSIALRLRQSLSMNGLESFGGDEEFLPDENVDAKLEAEENIGICAIIEVCGYTQMIESFAEKVPATAISKSLEAIIGKVIVII